MALERLRLTLACGRYDRTWPLADGRVEPEGIRLNLVFLEPEECFFRMLQNSEFDAAEMSLASFSILRARDDDRFVGIPAFLSRSFRHSSIYLPKDSGIADPKDLQGCRVGVPEYQITAAVWTRALLEHELGVDTRSIVWCTGGLEQPGRAERQPIQLPEWVKVEPLPPYRSLSESLIDGSLDALMAPRVPSVFRKPELGVKRLMPDFAARERDYWLRTRVFPIMHMVVVRSDLLERDPWVARSLYKALVEAKVVALHGLADAPALRYTMPFLLAALEEQEEVFGKDPWPYGVEENRSTLESFMRHLHEQGLTEEVLPIESLFAPSTMRESRI